MEIDFEKESETLLKKFKFNVFKASIISELREEHITSAFSKELIKEIENINISIGIDNLARNQAIVMLATSFEAFTNDFFKLMVLREDLLKSTLRKCDNLKIPSKEIVKLLNNKTSWGEVIIKKENLSFQNFNSLNRVCSMLGFSFEDLLEDAAREVDKYLDEESSGRTKLILSGEQLFKMLFENRHRIVHQSENIIIEEFDFRNLFLFFEFLTAHIRSKFFKTQFNLVAKAFVYEDIKQESENHE